MRFKLGENFGTRTQQIFQAAGHDVHSIIQESLQGIPDEVIYKVCCTEQRCLVTLDLDGSPGFTGIFIRRLRRLRRFTRAESA